jgi:diguanylate cyclase (GGDEF)-like protein/PAS domain S-box-containing protein
MRLGTRLLVWSSGHIVAVAVSLALGLLALSGAVVFRFHQAAWVGAQSEAQRVTLALHHELDRLAALAAEHFNLMAQQLALPDVQAMAPELRHRILFGHGASRLGSVMLINTEGEVIMDSRSMSPRGRRQTFLPMLAYHEAHPGDALQISVPFTAQSDGRLVMAVTRRYDGPHGQFAGIFATILDVGELQHLFEGVRIGEVGSVALIRNDGMLLLRAPYAASSLATNLTQTQTFQMLQSSPNAPFFARASLDQQHRFYVPRQVGALPATILVAVSTADVRAEWLPAATAVMVVSLSLAAALIGLGIFVRRELTQRRATAMLAQAKEGEFRLLADHSDDFVCRLDRNGAFLYASPAARRMIGHGAASLLGRELAQIVDQNDAPDVQAAVSPVLTGQDLATRVEFRVQHADGQTIWLEASIRATRDVATGEIDGLVAIMRDSTARRNREAGLLVAASTDPLTGLLNRTGFNAALAAACVAAAARQESVSVLLLDVDHFKQFNDTYGHPAGDACLAQVASALHGCIRAATDAVARYGGEEFGVVLQGAGPDAAALIAERLRAAVEGMAIPHVGTSHPSGIVTVSVGQATIWPSADADLEGTMAPLIKMADLGLYAAKDSGRNCIRTAGDLARAAVD